MTQLFNAADFNALREGGRWTLAHGFLNILSDPGAWSAYLVIPCVPGYFTLRRKDLPFRTLFLLIAAFILSCGTTHLMDAILFWWPAYRVAAVIKLFTTLVSWATVLALVLAAPKVLAMRSPEELQGEITQRKQAQEVAVAQAENLRDQAALLDLAHDAIFVRDLSATITFWNRGAEAMYGWASAQALGQTAHRLLQTEFPAPLQEIEAQVIRAGRWEGELIHTRQDGTRLVVASRWALQRDEQNRPRGFLEINRDITLRKRTEEALRLAHDELEQRVQERTIELATVNEGLRREVEDRRAAEARLRERAEEVEGLMALLPAAVWIAHDRECRRITGNAASYELLGLPANSNVSRSAPSGEAAPAFRCFQEGQELPPEKLPMQWAAAHGVEIRDVEQDLVFPDGSVKHIFGSARPLFDEAGQVRGCVATFMDITARKRAEELVRQARDDLEQRVRERTADLARQTALLQSVVQGIAEGLVVADEEGRFTLFNPAAERILGAGALVVRPEEWTERYGLYLPDAVTPYPAGELPLARAIRGEEVDNAEMFVRRPRERDGTWISCAARPLRDPANNLRGGLVVFRDVTERKQVEVLQHQAKEAAEAASRAKSAFLANMSHEIRTPLNGIVGLTELALETDLTAQQRDFLDALQGSAESLLRIVNDILDFSKIEAGKLDLDPHDFPLRQRLADMLRPLALRAERKGLELALDVAPDVPDVLNADPGRLQQILVNLVGNAIKFTERGKVVVRVRLGNGEGGIRKEEKEGCAADASSFLIHFEVNDTGVGIPPAQLAAIFAPFAQADSSTTRRYGGTGLGLTISLRLAELMGGRLQAKSEPGKGSTFHFTVRCVARPVGDSAKTGLERGRPARARPTAAVGRPLRVLLVEDNAVNQQVATLMLQQQGHTVTVAGNGQEALEALQRQAFDLVLMDVQMPEMDGLEATAAIRRKEQDTGRRLPIIALTAHALEGDRERCLAAGMDEYVSKPIRKEDLGRAIAAAVPSARAVTERPSTPNAGAPVPPGVHANEVLDAPALIERLGGNLKLLAQVLAVFQDECKVLMDEMRDAVEEGDGARIGRAAHTLKGTLGNLSAAAACAAALRLEVLAREGGQGDFTAAFRALAAEIERLQPALADLGTTLPSRGGFS